MYLRRAALALYLIPISASAAITAVSSLVDMPFSELALSRLLSSYQAQAVAVLMCGSSHRLRIEIQKAAYIDSLD